MKITCRASVIRFVGLMAVSVLAWAGASTFAGEPTGVAGSGERPKYVFLFIGDGMGPVQRQTANLAAKELNGQAMRMEQLPVRGQIHTRAANAEVTDSAAAATALCAGVKTDNGMLGQTPDGKPAEAINTRLARELGMKIGILSSVQLNHATPAAFFSHAGQRGSYDQIAAQVAAGGVDFLMGNGVLSESNRGQEIMASWKEQGLGVITDLSEAAEAGRLVAVLRFPGAPKEKSDLQAGPGMLARAVAFAVKRLDNPNGFFIMAEGGKVDSGGHANTAGMAIDETHALDRAVEVAYQFYLQHPKQTLIVVTADHETGGMGLEESKLNVKRLWELADLEPKLSAALGNDAETITEASVREAMKSVLGLAALDEQEQAALAKAIASTPKNRKAQTQLAAMKIAQARAGVSWSTGGHTAVDVPVTAIGVGAETFAGTYDNTEIPAKILKLATGTANAATREAELVPTGR